MLSRVSSWKNFASQGKSRFSTGPFTNYPLYPQSSRTFSASSEKIFHTSGVGGESIRDVFGEKFQSDAVVLPF
jgi:hypothetical protein